MQLKKIQPAISLHTIILPAIIFLLCVYSHSSAQVRKETINQIKSLIAEKQSRTGTDRKISSQLLQATREAGGKRITEGVNLLPANVGADKNGRLLVDITGNVSKALIDKIKAVGANIVFFSLKFHSIRAKINLSMVENIASFDEVTFIKSAARGVSAGADIDGSGNGERDIATTAPYINASATETPQQKNLKEPVSEIKQKIQQYLITPGTGSVTSQGDRTHGADVARNTYGYEGKGIRIGVLGDSYNTLNQAATDVSTGDLPGVGNPMGDTIPVTVLQDGIAGLDEGRAMLQIIHDLAPKAQLFFASAEFGEASFAANILALRAAPYNCDIIVDDYHYYDEPVFQDGIIAQAVNSVTSDGCLYFTSAGNEGSVLMQTSGVWEGDFNDNGSPVFAGASKIGTVHNFGTLAAPQIGDSLLPASPNAYAYTLKWSDPLGGSGNDYDLFLIDSNGNVKASSTDIQDGTQDPVEGWDYPPYPTRGDQLVVFKAANAQVRAINLNTIGGMLLHATNGQIFGHFAGANAFTIAATPAPAAYPNLFSATDMVESFSSDGPRRTFFNADSTPITPGNFLFGTNGGTVLNKPDFTAADGVSTTLTYPYLHTFYGTSAAGPHAAAIAALLKSAQPSLNSAQIKTLLINSALDIEAPGYDINSGYGIIQAIQVMQALNPKPMPNMKLGLVTASEGTFSNHNGYIDPGETANLIVQLTNPSLSNATLVSAKITSNTPGITILHDSAYYGNILKSSSVSNISMPFTFAINSSVACRSSINFWILARFDSMNASPKAFSFQVNVSGICPAVGGTCTPIRMVTHLFSGGAINTPYKQTFTASGGSSTGVYAFSYSGLLPSGLTLAGDSIVGRPTEPGGFPLIISAADPAGCPGGNKKDTVFIAGNIPSIVPIQGTPQSTVTNQPFADTLKAMVMDTANIPLSGVSVTFSAPQTYTKASGLFQYSSTAIVITDNNGIATAPVFAANNIGGSYSVSAAITGTLQPAIFHLTNACIPTVVTTNADTGAGSLRYIIANACPGSVITFAPGISQINLTAGELDINQALTIKGPGAKNLTISGSNAYRVFSINPNGFSQRVTISGLTIRDGFIAPDFTGQGGGGIFIEGGIVTITGCVISNNDVSTAPDPEGGGINISNADTLYIRNTSVIANTAYSSGGGINFQNGVLYIANSTVSGNKVVSGTGIGGGIYSNSQLQAYLSGCTVFGNTAQSGANIYNNSYYNSGYYSGTVNLSNSIVAGGITGTDSTAADLYGGNFISTGYNLIQNDSSVIFSGDTSTNITGLSPNLLPLYYNGGNTPTMLPLPNSPAINNGDTSLSPAGSDQRGYTRVSGGRADIGAVETNYISVVKAGSGQSATVKTKFPIVLRSQLTESGNPIKGIQIIFTAPSGGPALKFTGNKTNASVITNTQGIGISPVITANNIAGTYLVVDSVAGAGNIIPNVYFTLTNTAASGSDLNISFTGNGNSTDPAMVYPNPAHSALTVAISGNDKQTLSVFNSMGQLVKRYMSVTGRQEIDISKWANGVYLFSITKDYKNCYTVKIIKN